MANPNSTHGKPSKNPLSPSSTPNKMPVSPTTPTSSPTVFHPTTYTNQPPSFCQSMNYPADAEIPNAVYQARIAEGMQAWTATSTKTLHLTIDVEARRVGAQTSMPGKWKNEAGEDAKLDFAWFLESGDDGKEVVRVVEYLDPSPVKEYYAKIQAILAARENRAD